MTLSITAAYTGNEKYKLTPFIMNGRFHIQIPWVTALLPLAHAPPSIGKSSSETHSLSWSY